MLITSATKYVTQRPNTLPMQKYTNNGPLIFKNSHKPPQVYDRRAKVTVTKGVNLSTGLPPREASRTQDLSRIPSATYRVLRVAPVKANPDMEYLH